MTKRLQAIPLVFFKTASGEEPVREWLRSLRKDDRHEIGNELRAVQFGWPIGMPLCRSLGGGLWEVRVRLPSKRQARLVFAFDEGTLVVLHGFIKKTQKTPRGDLDLARARLAEIAE